jgi:hypothetical protein
MIPILPHHGKVDDTRPRMVAHERCVACDPRYSPLLKRQTAAIIPGMRATPRRDGRSLPDLFMSRGNARHCVTGLPPRPVVLVLSTARFAHQDLPLQEGCNPKWRW